MGKIDNPGPVIRERIGARYLFTDARECTDLVAKGLDSGWFEIAYEDNEAYYVRIRDERGEPPPLEEPEEGQEEIPMDENPANNFGEDEEEP